MILIRIFLDWVANNIHLTLSDTIWLLIADFSILEIWALDCIMLIMIHYDNIFHCALLWIFRWDEYEITIVFISEEISGNKDG